MVQRHSIEIEGFKHSNPIPAASRIGNIMMSGVVLGRHPETGDLPDTLEEQAAFMFQHVKHIVEAAGGTTDNIIKITVWMKDRSQRAATNEHWVAMFPDPESRPARHTLPDPTVGGPLISCDITAVFDD